MIYLARGQQGRGQPASVAAKVQRMAEAPVDVGKAFDKGARQAGLEEVKSRKVTCGAVAVASHGSAVEDGGRCSARGCDGGHEGGYGGDGAIVQETSERNRGSDHAGDLAGR